MSPTEDIKTVASANTQTTEPVVGKGDLLTPEETEVHLALQNYEPGTEAERKLLWKIDLILLPTLWIMYILAYIDRGNIANSKAAGMYDDLNMSDSDYSMIISIFFIAYLIFEVPSNLLLTRVRPSIILPTIMLCWGAFVTGIAGAQSVSAVLGLRFMIGIFEAGLFPGALFLISCWYKKEEAAKRFCIFFTSACVSPALGGIMAGAIIRTLDGSHGRAGWRWLFLIEGVMTMGWALILYFIMLDYPATSKFMSLEERQLATVRIMYDKNANALRGMRKLTPLEAVKALFADPRTYFFVLFYVLLNGSTGISYFIPTILRNMGYTSVSAQWMTVPIWMSGAVANLALSWTSDRTGDRHWHITILQAIGFASIVVCATVDNDAARYAMLCIFVATVYTAVPLLFNWIAEIVFYPPEKRSVTIALVNSVGNLAIVYSSFLWPSTDAPRYTKGFSVNAAFLGSVTILSALLPTIFKFLPKRSFVKAEEEIRIAAEELGSSATTARGHSAV